VCVDVSKSLRNETKYEQCFNKEGVCFVTYGQAMGLSAAGHFCEIYPNKSVLPTISNDTRLQAFDLYLKEAQNVTENQPLWLDIHKSQVQTKDAQPKGKWSCSQIPLVYKTCHCLLAHSMS